MAAGGRRAIFAAFAANLGVAVAKLVGFLITGAATLFAEAIHSVADCGNQLLLLLGYARAERRPTTQHPFGYGRERYFWSFVVALVLFSLGSLFAIREGIDKLRHPHELVSPAWAIGILLLALALEGAALRTAVVAASKLREGRSWWSFIRRAKTPEIPVLLLEDSGAMLGLVIALVCVSLALVTGDPRWDAIGSVAIGILLGVIAVFLAIEMQSLLIGESASPSVEAEIREVIENHERVRSLVHMRTQHLGPDELLVAVKADFEPTLTIEELVRTIDDLEARVRRHTPAARVIYVEPDIARAEPAGEV